MNSKINVLTTLFLSCSFCSPLGLASPLRRNLETSFLFIYLFIHLYIFTFYLLIQYFTRSSVINYTWVGAFKKPFFLPFALTWRLLSIAAPYWTPEISKADCWVSVARCLCSSFILRKKSVKFCQSLPNFTDAVVLPQRTIFCQAWNLTELIIYTPRFEGKCQSREFDLYF